MSGVWDKVESGTDYSQSESDGDGKCELGTVCVVASP